MKLNVGDVLFESMSQNIGAITKIFDNITNLFKCNVAYYTYYWFMGRLNLIFVIF